MHALTTALGPGSTLTASPSLKDAPAKGAPPGVAWAKVDYTDVGRLAAALRGVDTVLSFIVVSSDPGSVSQKNLVDAAVRAGVRRIAPSEWGG
jgi:uncharacterized protein YbjT (DUF2867 family)